MTSSDGAAITQAGAASPSARPTDPRVLLAEWANGVDEWVRLVVGEAITTGRPVAPSVIQNAYKLFREEKSLDQREMPAVPPLSLEARQDESAPPLSITRLADVRGVNALIPGGEIEPRQEGLTILYGENGTGKTGYSRIFKALANSRTADAILGNVDADAADPQSATINFIVGDEGRTLKWQGERGVSPFTRMSIFDSPAVRTHVDDDLEYVYTPTSLALFNDTVTAMQGVATLIDNAASELEVRPSGLLTRFKRGSSVYPLVEALGASTDTTALKAKARFGEEAAAELDELALTVASLQANTTGAQLTASKSHRRALTEAAECAATLESVDAEAYRQTLERSVRLAADYEVFRSSLFAAADLPSEPEQTWEAFIESGEEYKRHLVSRDAHDSGRCLYCRQSLTETASDLVARYASYLEDRISVDIQATEAEVALVAERVAKVGAGEMAAFLDEQEPTDPELRPAFSEAIRIIESSRIAISDAVTARKPYESDVVAQMMPAAEIVKSALDDVLSRISDLEEQQRSRAEILVAKQGELLELSDAIELGKSWSTIEALVNSAKEADRLRTLKTPIPGLSRSVTSLAKAASNELVNRSFDVLFEEERTRLNAPDMKIQYVGSAGKSQRRKVRGGKHKPSKVLSEGEQKVLAIADFLAEARLAGITAPVIFDDPVSSLDHRRINQVAERIASLAETNQVIVFTHDILFATTLLALFDRSKRCVLFQITDEHGKGTVTRSTGLRTDSLSAIKGRINDLIQTARKHEGQVRDSLVRSGYSQLRAWCEVFTEEELLRGVTKRYRANVQMTTLARINGALLDEIAPKVSAIFEVACRHTDSHSQPLVTLSVAPTLSDLEQHWDQLKALKARLDEAQQ